METEVGSFRGLTNFDDGTKWDVKTALDFFYQFIIPQDQSYTDIQKRIRTGLIRWMRSKRKWSENPTFKDAWDLDTFNAINKQALDTLLNTKLSDLNNNRYYQDDEKGNKQVLSFADEVIETTSNGETSRYEIKYGRTFKENVKGLNVLDADKYNIARNLLIEGKNELRALQIERDTRSGGAQAAFTKKINKLNNAIKEAEQKFNEQLKTMYNDDITLRQVMENNPIVEQFYSAVTLEPQTEKEKIALGILIESVEKTIDRELYERKYSMLTGEELSYEDFEKLISDTEAEYLKLLALPQVASKTGLLGASKTSVDIKININSLFESREEQKEGQTVEVKAPLVRLAEQLPYPIEFSNEEVSDIKNDKEFIKFIKEKDIESVQNLIRRSLNLWNKHNLEPLLNAQADITVTSTSVRERGPDEISDRPVKMSRDTIEEFILDTLVNPDNVQLYLEDIKTNKTKFKLPLSLKEGNVDFESGYARTIGASSRNVISSEQTLEKEINREGKVIINYTGNIPKDIIGKLPGVDGNYQWKKIREVLVNFYRTKKLTTKERIVNKTKKYITSDLLGNMELIAGIITQIKDLQSEGLNKEDIIDLKDFIPSSYIEKNGSFKYTVNELIEKLTGDVEDDAAFTSKQSQNFISKLLVFQKIMNSVLLFAEENKELIDVLEEEVEEDKDLTEEEFRERMKDESDKLRVQQERLEGFEEEEREAEGALAGTEGEAAGEQMMVDESLEDFDDLLTGKTFELLRQEEFLDLLQEILNYERTISNLDNRLTLLRNDLSNVVVILTSLISTTSDKSFLNKVSLLSKLLIVLS